ncbi:MAG TPA: helix-hairpin-helix domain-containing protein [Kofleriaceae bacterium]|jgi:competence ComEA-like helix-hairpin-helix protein
MFLWRVWLRRSGVAVLALAALVIAMDGKWTVSASAAPAEQRPPAKREPPGPTSPPPPAIPIIVPAVPPVAQVVAHGGHGGRGGHGQRRAKSLTGKVNVNTADFEQLRLLPNVGPMKAERLLKYRQVHGPFRGIVQLRAVKGFGLKTLKELEPFLAFSGDTTLAVQ